MVLIAFPQAGGLQHAGENHFPPIALGFVIALQRFGQVQRLLRHLRVQLLQVADLMRQGVPFSRLLTEALLHLPAEPVQLFAQRCQQAMQALAILLIDASVAVFENAVGEVFKLLAQALLAVHHLADLIFRMQLGGFEPGGNLTQIGLQRGIDIPQAAQLVVQQLALFTPVGFLYQLLTGSAQLNIQLSPLLDKIGPNLIGARFGRQPADD